MKTNKHLFRIILAMPIKADGADFAHQIARSLTSRFGGARVIEATGYWSPDGRPPMVEPCFIVEVTTEYNEGHQIIGLVRLAADALAERDEALGLFDASQQWIQLEHQLINVQLFQVE